MPRIPFPRRFHYHGAAHALSLQFHRPIHHLIEVQAPTSLPVTGGHGSARVDNFRFNGLVSFAAGYTHVSGSEQVEQDALYYTTLVTSVVEGLNILDVVTADRIVARLSASYELGDKDDEAHIVLLGTHFENLRILGFPVTVTLHNDLLFTLDTFGALAADAGVKAMAADLFLTGEKYPVPNKHGVVLCSLIDKMGTTCPGVKLCAHHGFEIPKFGRIFLAELIAEHGKRTLTMLRLELGSPVAGVGAAVQISGNGHTWP